MKKSAIFVFWVVLFFFVVVMFDVVKI